jgi:hypothetical protein
MRSLICIGTVDKDAYNRRRLRLTLLAAGKRMAGKTLTTETISDAA